MSEQCQVIQSIPKVSEGLQAMPRLGLVGYGRLLLQRALSTEQKRRIKRRLAPVMHGRLAILTGSQGMAAREAVERERETVGAARRSASVPADGVAETFAAGDAVRVRSRESIAETLDTWGELKGCGFLPEMWRYCGTTQHVLKPVQRFVDERDRRVKKASGLYLLDDVMCEGTEWFGRCDRSCLYFWRREWLERVAPEV